jgi:hypothetical protein
MFGCWRGVLKLLGLGCKVDTTGRPGVVWPDIWPLEPGIEWVALEALEDSVLGGAGGCEGFVWGGKKIRIILPVSYLIIRAV